MSEFRPPDGLYDSKTLYTLGGASTAVWILSGVIVSVFKGIDKEYVELVGLIVALFLAFAGAFQAKKKLRLSIITVAFFNGLLIYVTSSGIASINQGVGSQKVQEGVDHSSLLDFKDVVWWKPIVLVDSIKSLQKENVITTDRLIYVESQLDSTIQHCDQLDSLMAVNLMLQENLLAKGDDAMPTSAFSYEPPKSSSRKGKQFSKYSIKCERITSISLFQKKGLMCWSDTILPPIYDDLERKFTYRDLNKVKKRTGWGVVDNDASIIVDLIYQDVKVIHEVYGLEFFLIKKHDVWGAMNANSKVLINPIFDAMKMQFVNRDAYFIVKKNEKWGVINERSKLIVKPQFDDIEVRQHFAQGHQIFLIKKNEKWGAVLSNSKALVKAKYDHLETTRMNGKTYFLTQKDGKWGALNERAGTVVKVQKSDRSIVLGLLKALNY